MIATTAKQTARYEAPLTAPITAAQTQTLLNKVKSFTPIKFNDVILDSRLPAPIAGWNYKPYLLNSPSPNTAYSHINGYKSELMLANEVVAIPNQAVIKYGDAIGRNGSDIISVDVSTGKVTLWDAKYRSANSKLGASPTFVDGPKRASAVDEAIREIQKSNLPSNVKEMALTNLRNQTFSTYTVATGNSKNSVIFNCINKVCQ